jgi:hypothetical protein
MLVALDGFLMGESFGFFYQMSKEREALLTATLLALPPDQNTFGCYFTVFRNHLEQLNCPGTKGAEYLALAVRLTRRINVLRAQRDSGGMAGMILYKQNV